MRGEMQKEEEMTRIVIIVPETRPQSGLTALRMAEYDCGCYLA